MCAPELPIWGDAVARGRGASGAAGPAGEAHRATARSGPEPVVVRKAVAAEAGNPALMAAILRSGLL